MRFSPSVTRALEADRIRLDYPGGGMFNVGPTELMVILILALIVFGPKRLPEMGRSIGKGLREFRKAQMDIKREITQGLDDSPTNETPPVSPSAPATGTSVSDGQGPSEQTSS